MEGLQPRVRDGLRCGVVDNFLKLFDIRLVNVLCNCIGLMRRSTPTVMEAMLDEVCFPHMPYSQAVSYTHLTLPTKA